MRVATPSVEALVAERVDWCRGSGLEPSAPGTWIEYVVALTGDKPSDIQAAFDAAIAVSTTPSTPVPQPPVPAVIMPESKPPTHDAVLLSSFERPAPGHDE